jgi:protein-S-isoprenylcysteine O-methyltransferase Ste14
MRLDTAEKIARWTCAAGVLAFTSVVVFGLYHGSHRPKGRVSGAGPFVASGSLKFYLPATVAALWLMSRLWRPLPLRLTPVARVVALVLGSLLNLTGLAIMFWGRSALGEMYGVSSSRGAQLYADHRLITTGPFSLVRHPMYLGGQLAEVGALLLFRTWAVLVIASNAASLVLRARREEEALAAEFGAEWDHYRRRVPFLYPRIRGLGV